MPVLFSLPLFVAMILLISCHSSADTLKSAVATLCACLWDDEPAACSLQG